MRNSSSFGASPPRVASRRASAPFAQMFSPGLLLHHAADHRGAEQLAPEEGAHACRKREVDEEQDDRAGQDAAENADDLWVRDEPEEPNQEAREQVEEAD